MKKIYLAGGWFTPEMEEEHTRIYNLIKDKFDVFNPKLEGIVSKESDEITSSNILIGNLKGINNADLVLVIYDYKDSGTIWESGYAYAKYKPILYYAEKLNGKKFNLMLAKTGYFASNEKELIELLNNEHTYNYHTIYEGYKGDIE